MVSFTSFMGTELPTAQLFKTCEQRQFLRGARFSEGPHCVVTLEPKAHWRDAASDHWLAFGYGTIAYYDSTSPAVRGITSPFSDEICARSQDARETVPLLQCCSLKPLDGLLAASLGPEALIWTGNLLQLAMENGPVTTDLPWFTYYIKVVTFNSYVNVWG